MLWAAEVQRVASALGGITHSNFYFHVSSPNHNFHVHSNLHLNGSLTVSVECPWGH